MKRFLTLVTLPVLLAGCSAQGSVTATQPTANAGTPATTAATGSQPGATADGSAVPIGTTATNRCHSADLSVTLGSSDGAAGGSYQTLIFTNKSGKQCTLYGYPGVSWVTGDSGTQVNSPFVREGGAAAAVALAPGGAAHTVLGTHDVGTVDAAKCKPVSARGLRIFPPDEKAAIFVSAPQTVCSATGVNLGQVKPISSGAADS